MKNQWSRIALFALLALLVAPGVPGCNAILGAGDYTFGEGGAGAAGVTASTTGTQTGQSVSNTDASSASSTGGGGPLDPCDIPLENKPIIEVSGDVDADFTLTCDRRYKITGEVFVKPPTTLTIQAGTTVLGDRITGGVLVIQPGAKIVANGQPDKPIVFTSEAGDGFADPGDWGGLILLGNAPINVRDANGNPTFGEIEGIVDAANARYGGENPDDSSGTLRYVRVEYGGKAIAPNNEVNGLTFGGVGRGTIVDSVMVRQTTDDCFEFFGGTVDAKHLICQAPGDDGFDWDLGYSGRLQFLVLQQDTNYPAPGDMNAFEGDNDAAGSMNTPISEPTIYNATLCGQDYGMKEQYGALLRKGTKAHLHNLAILGFEAAVDLRNAVAPGIDFSHAILFGNVQLAYPETGAAPYNDDDGGFDELAWLLDPSRSVSQVNPQIAGCNNMAALDLVPAAPVVGVAPPSDGFFDATANFDGAFRDANDAWAKGAWVEWAAE